jgi:myo-inositol-1(or 4)-monophosphatase
VRRAGEHLLASFERLPETDVHHKGRVDLVTRLDVEAQAIVVEGLAAAFPDETIWAEEAAPEGGIPAGPVWFVDPLDGTTNYVHGQPPFAVSVGRAGDTGLEIGMVYAPYLHELFWGVAGCGAWLNDRRLSVSHRDALEHSLLATGFAYDVATHPRDNLREWAHLARRCRGLRRAGAASLDLAYVAAGRLDGYWEFRLRPWDLAAGALLVCEAGGRVSEPAGGAGFLQSGDVVATNGRLHALVCAELAAAAATAHPLDPAAGAPGTREASSGF